MMTMQQQLIQQSTGHSRMPNRFQHRSPVFKALALGLLGIFLYSLSAPAVWACACGCGMFDIGTSSMMPNGEGGIAYVEWDTMNQNRNWSGYSASDASNNSDKQIYTDFYTFGVHYMFNRTWGVQVQVPYWERTFKAADDSGNVGTANYSGLGDIRVSGVYTGFSPDLSTGVTFGLKLPTGNFKQTSTQVDIDRDTQIGSGSTDLILGMYHVGALTDDNRFSWFGQARTSNPFSYQDDYYPGAEINGALGVVYNAGSVGFLDKLAPLLQVKVANRGPDSGANATLDAAGPVDANGSPTSPASGYRRVYVAPALEMDIGRVRIFTEVALPVYTYTIGNQLVADVLYKVLVGYTF